MTCMGRLQLQSQKPSSWEEWPCDIQTVKLPIASSNLNPKVYLSQLHPFTHSYHHYPSFHLQFQRQQFQDRSQPHHGRQPDDYADRSKHKPRLWRQRQRPAPSALATVLTGTRSGYFFRIFSPSERRFSNGCSSLYTNFILPGTGLDRTGLREPREGGAGTGAVAATTVATAQANSAEGSQGLRHFPIRQPRPRRSRAILLASYASSAAALTLLT